MMEQRSVGSGFTAIKLTTRCGGTIKLSCASHGTFSQVEKRQTDKGDLVDAVANPSIQSNQFRATPNFAQI